ncbi:MAG: hypothetical protein ACM3P0_02690 [Acidobacteriota bacterium]
MVSRLSILIFLLFASFSFAQQVNSNPDSLLLEGDFIKLQEALKNADAFKAASYQGVISAVKEIPGLNNKDILIGQAKSYKNYYTESHAGAAASKAFAKFESSEGNGNHDEAITYFYIARFFKNNYISGLKSNLDRDFRDAYESFSRRDLKKSLELCEYIKGKSELNPFFPPAFKDSVKSFSIRVKEKFLTDEKEKNIWVIESIDNHNFWITLGGGLLYYPSVTQYEFPFYLHKTWIKIPAKLKGTAGYAFSLSAGYKITDKIRINLAYLYGNSKYKEFELQDNVLAKTDLKVNSHDAMLTARYYLKTAVGLCPYLGMGCGYSIYTWNNFSFPKSERFFQDSNYRDFIRVSLKEKSFNSMLFNALCGLDYFPSANSRFMYNLGLSFDKASKVDYFLKGNKLSVGFNVGILL